MKRWFRILVFLTIAVLLLGSSITVQAQATTQSNSTGNQKVYLPLVTNLQPSSSIQAGSRIYLPFVINK